MIVTTVRPDSELYRPWNAAELHAVLDVPSDPASTSTTC